MSCALADLEYYGLIDIGGLVGTGAIIGINEKGRQFVKDKGWA